MADVTRRPDRSNDEGDNKPQFRRQFFRRRRSCPFTGADAEQIDWKDIKMLDRFRSERGKIIPSRISAVSTKKQRELAKALKRARYMALMPYVDQ